MISRPQVDDHSVGTFKIFKTYDLKKTITMLDVALTDGNDDAVDIDVVVR